MTAIARLLLLCTLYVLTCSVRGDSKKPITKSNKRGQDGLFLGAVNSVESRSAKLTAEARKRALELDEKVAKMSENAWKQAEKEQRMLEAEAKRVVEEAQAAANKKLAEWEQSSRERAAEMERAARERAKQVTAIMERAARKRAAVLERSLNREGAKVERSVTKFLKSAPVAEPTRARIIRERIAGIALWLLILEGSITSMTNLLGEPPAVLEHWEDTIFGQEFFPFDMNLTDKRLLAGAMEFLSVVMLSYSPLRKYGAAIIGIMYGRGSWINTKIDDWKALTVGIGAILALLVVVL